MNLNSAIQPPTESNITLRNNVHPPDWQNPQPASCYNLVVIGAGTAGLVSAAGAAGLGAKVALIERDLMGGDCLNVGCVPSKGIIRASRAVHDVMTASKFGISGTESFNINFPFVMERMRRIRAGISRHDSARRFSEELGIDVFFGSAIFAGNDVIEVEGKQLRFKKAAICTGARAAAPSIPGIEKAGYLTNETVFSLTKLPPRLAVIGAGPIGCELAQAFARLGSRVTIVGHLSEHILPREDPDAAEILQKAFTRDGIRLFLPAENLQIELRNGEKVLIFRHNGKQEEITVDEILVGIGRSPNVEGLNLEEASIKYDSRQGVKVNERLQTSNPRVYGRRYLLSHVYPYSRCPCTHTHCRPVQGTRRLPRW
jgi:pyruvate/2-oxoglutarate dehydrogenase complex dihydrolipoamide dehydrogenase (E3) component